MRSSMVDLHQTHNPPHSVLPRGGESRCEALSLVAFASRAILTGLPAQADVDAGGEGFARGEDAQARVGARFG